MEGLPNARGTRARSLTKVALFAALTSVLAFISIPLPLSPVPVTAQSFGAMLAGLILEPREAASSQALYVLLGVAGMPVFAGNSSGLGVLIGPTGGYLWGFIAGAYVTAFMARRCRWASRQSAAHSILASIVGCVAVVYVAGVIQLSLAAQLSLGKAVAAGALPFIPGDLLKAVAAGLAGSRLRRILRLG